MCVCVCVCVCDVCVFQQKKRVCVLLCCCVFFCTRESAFYETRDVAEVFELLYKKKCLGSYRSNYQHF